MVHKLNFAHKSCEINCISLGSCPLFQIILLGKKIPTCTPSKEAKSTQAINVKIQNKSKVPEGRTRVDRKDKPLPNKSSRMQYIFGREKPWIMSIYLAEQPRIKGTSWCTPKSKSQTVTDLKINKWIQSESFISKITTCWWWKSYQKINILNILLPTPKIK